MSEDQDARRPGDSAQLERGVATDIAVVAAPLAVAVAPALAVATDHFLNRPAEPEAPKVELPAGVDRD